MAQSQQFEANRRAYDRLLPSLIDHDGKFVVIHKGESLGYYDTYADALRVGYSKSVAGEFLVKQISRVRQVAYFTRDIRS